MKLRKALKVKKQLLKEIAEFKSKINRNNSVLKDNYDNRQYSTKKLYDDLTKKINQLVTLKLIISKANENIQYEIFMLSEYKSLITFLKSISVINGFVSGYDKEVLCYSSEMTEKDIDEMVTEIENQIDAMQEIIDEYNATIEVDFNLKTEN